MHRGVEVAVHLSPELDDPDAIASALGNLAAYRLAQQRGERLVWQVLRVVESDGKHFYRLLIGHPDRLLDVGIHDDLRGQLDALSAMRPEELQAALRAAVAAGLTPVPLRQVEYQSDYWRDDFWNYFR